jgi:hypothetical protein
LISLLSSLYLFQFLYFPISLIYKNSGGL